VHRLALGLADDLSDSRSAESHRTWLAFVWMGLVLIVCRGIAAQVLHVYDDAFITFRYARNLAMGYGFVYHPGEWVLGTTAPGFGLLCSLFYLFRLSMPQTVVVLNSILDIATFYLTLFALPRSERYWGGALFCALFAISPIMARISVGAMEMSLYLTCSLVSILLYVSRHKKAAIVLAALCYSLRPEALILLGLLVATEWFSGKRADALKLGLIAGLFLILQLIVIFSVYGQVVSQSVVSKAGTINSPLLEVLSKLLVPDPLIVCLIPLAIWGWVVTARQSSFIKITGIWSALYVLAYALARPKIWTWYGATIYYAVLLLAALGGVNLIKQLPRLRPTLSRQWVAFAIDGLAIAVWTIVWFRPGPTGVTRNIYESLEAWCQENTQADTSILAYDIGAIGYYCNVRIYDMYGLVWPAGLSLTEAEVIQTYSPDYLFLNVMQGTMNAINSAPLNRLYKPVKRFSKSGTPSLGNERERYPDQWVQDYVMLRKQSQ
jgi:hypothetical protein